jgi:hypothetical protein
MRQTSTSRRIAAIAVLTATLPGCGNSSAPPAEAPATAPQSAATASPEAASETPVAAVPTFEPIRLGDDPASVPTTTGDSGSADVAATPESRAAHREAVLAAMMPVQIMLGAWRGITQNQIGDFKGIDQPEWVWDFQTDRDRPAMVMQSADGAYFREARLTYAPADGQFRMTTTDPEGRQRTFEGEFTEEPQDVQGDDKKLHRTYKLTLTEVDPLDAKDQWQVVFNQQENNRYLMELYKKRGGTFARFETVATQREGTSFALNDSDYGERTCIISGGLGTIQVSYQGKSYWVCCTGCQAAFEDDPATWIAEYEAKQKKAAE